MTAILSGDAPVAIVTGGTRGLGAAIGRSLVEAGNQVIALYRSDRTRAAQLESELGASAAVLTRDVDVADPDLARAFVGEVLEQPGRIDILVNNAGSLTERRLAEIDGEMWERSLRINLSSSFYLAQAVIPSMREAGYGRIVNVGSLTALMGSPFQIDYGTAKAGLIGLTRSLARGVARHGITVNCIIPGGFETDMLGELTLTNKELLASNVPVGRYGRPHELAHIVRCLTHPDASYITGAVIPVDGGMGMGL